jgi:serine/threonine-protein kinase
MRGLERIHAAGIAHGALRPQYLRVTDRRQVKIVGFGLQVLEGEGLSAHGDDPLRVLAYRAPEQIRGGRADRATDVWALGILLYESITGRRPFEKNTVGALGEAILGGKPKSFASLWADAPLELDRLLARALSKEAAKRHPGVRDLARELHAAARQIEDPTRVVMKPRRKAAGDKAKKAKKPVKTGTSGASGSEAEKTVAQPPPKPAAGPEGAAAGAAEPVATGSGAGAVEDPGVEPAAPAAAVDPAAVDPVAVDPAAVDPAGAGWKPRIAATLLILFAALAVLWLVIL